MKATDETNKGGVPSPAEEENFKGYTLDELRYQRALIMLKREFLKEKAVQQTQSLRKRIPVINGKSPLSGMSPQSMVGRVIRGLNYADYIMLGISAFTAGKKIFSLFKKKKK